MDDGKLLRLYARDGSEAAFGQIVTRHRALVYATCLREIGSPSQAEDAAQVVFLLLSRKAKGLRPGPSLAGWLFRAARFVARDVRKQEARRQRREEIVLEELTPRSQSPAPEWQRVEPLLNGALSALRPAERELILLRFLEGLSLSETGAALGLSEDAARMRVTRAIEKMRRWLAAHGASVTSVALAGLLTAEATRPIPARAAEALPNTHVLLLLKGVSHTMKIVQVKVAAFATCVILGGAALPLLAHALSPQKANISVRQVSPQPTLAEFYTNQQPPILETLIMPDTLGGQNGMAGGAPHGEGNMRIITYTSPSSFRTVCQFYSDKMLPPGAKPQAMGVQGDLKKQSAYSLEERPGLSAATFSQRTSTYAISVFINRGAADKVTAVTLIYGLN